MTFPRTRMYYRPPKPKKPYEHPRFYPANHNLVHFGSPDGTTYEKESDDD